MEIVAAEGRSTVDPRAAPPRNPSQSAFHPPENRGMDHHPRRTESGTFSIDELFFSTTDPKGVITSCNGVFERVAGYTDAGLIGRAHNVVRHPDMPRAIFQLLWDGIGAGQSIAAYVKNRTKDGGHYWVMASVAPVEGGYLSVRLKPTTPLFDAARRIYAELRPLELAIESGEGKARKRAIEASTARLGELLAAAGYGSYRAFMHEALAAEMAARESVCDRTRAAPRAGDPELEAVLAAPRRCTTCSTACSRTSPATRS